MKYNPTPGMPHAKRNNAVTAVYLLLKRGGNILMMRRFNTGYQDGKYDLPSGHIDAGELPTQAMIREAKEEAGVIIESAHLRFIHAMFRTEYDNTGDRVDYFFEAMSWKGEAFIAEPHKCDDLLWVSPYQLPKHTVPHVRVALENIAQGKMFSELGLDFSTSRNY